MNLLLLLAQTVMVLAFIADTARAHCADRKQVFFLALGDHLGNSTKCAIRSACVLNPNLRVVVYGESGEVQQSLSWVRQHGCPDNVDYMELVEKDIYANTPFAVLHDNPERNLTTGPFHLNNRANALRLALLWKNGGGYLDTDMISVRSLRFLPCDALGAQSTATHDDEDGKPITIATKMNTAAMTFSSNSSYLAATMRTFVREFHPYTWAYQGPHLVSRVYFRKFKTEEFMHRVVVLKEEVFYPVGMDTNKQVKPFFVEEAHQDFIENGFPWPTLGVHLWNKHSSSWLERGRKGERQGWMQHPRSRGSLLLDACLADAPLGRPFFHVGDNHPDNHPRDLLLCQPAVYCGK